MSFLSFIFAIFLGFALAAYYAAPVRWRPAVLLGFSCAFYASWGPWPVALMTVITLCVHAAARRIDATHGGHGNFGLTILMVTVLVVILAAFKCEQLWASACQSAAAGKLPGTVVRLLVPLGLSYYLFKAIGYLLDVYWEKIPAERSAVRVALYVSFFPQIVCGPIQRAPDFFTQLNRLKTPEAPEITAALRRILFGIFKKIAIADTLAPVVAQVHNNPAGFSTVELIFAAVCFTLQLYADFSGLTDIAIGLGLLFGIRGPENFNRPFASANLQEFWRRWHMSLTSWLTDYLFMPLRMSLRRLGDWGLAIAVFANLLAVGLWHGVTWCFAAFGALHGILLTVSVLTLKKRNAFFKKHDTLAGVRKVTGPVLTFGLVAFSLIFFRAESFGEALTYLKHLVGFRSPGISPWRFDLDVLEFRGILLLRVALLILVMEAIHWAAQRPEWMAKFLRAPRWQRWAIYYGAISIVVWSVQMTGKFIYAQF